jgi:hypothetical protein
MPLDPRRLRFNGKAFVAAHRFAASLEGADAAPFLDALYSEWTATGQDISEVGSWLSVRLKGEFKAVGPLPEWVEEEPSWPYLDGKPMVFISQASTGEISPRETAYLFGARRPRGTGFEIEYRVVSQFVRP